MESSALTDRSYWNHIWSSVATSSIDLVGDPRQAWIDRCLRTRLRPGRRFLEVGVGGSQWPVHAARVYGADSWGIDFSRPGLTAVDRAARAARVAVRLVEADLFDESALPRAAFDVVYSGGFVEHFADAGPLMRRLATLLRPGGVVVTSVPNLLGINGLVQRVVDRACYDRHVLFTPRSLDAAHFCGGLVPVSSARYLGVLDLGAINFGPLDGLPKELRRVFWVALGLSRSAAEGLGFMLGRSDGGKLLSPSLCGAYRAAGAGSDHGDLEQTR